MQRLRLQSKNELGRGFYEDRVEDEMVKGELHAFIGVSIQAYVQLEQNVLRTSTISPTLTETSRTIIGSK